MKLGAVTALFCGLVFAVALGIPERDLSEAQSVRARLSDSYAESDTAAEDDPLDDPLAEETARLLSKISRHQEQIVAAARQRQAEAVGEVTRPAVAVADEYLAPAPSSSSSSSRSEKEALEMQQEVFIKELRKLRSELAEAKQDKEEYKARASELELKLFTVSDKNTSNDELQMNLQSALNKKEDELKSLRERMSQATSGVEACEEKMVEKDRLLARLPEVANKFDELKSTVLQREQELVACNEQTTSKEKEFEEKLASQEVKFKEELALKEAKFKEELAMKEAIIGGIPELKKKLVNANNNLMMKNMEIQVLQRGASKETVGMLKRFQIEQRNQMGSTTSAAKSVEAAIIPSADEVIAAASDTATSDTAAVIPKKVTTTTTTTSKEPVVLQVTRNKANLRSGPGVEHSPLMQVGLGTRLTVESRQGEWYRVYTPTGTRAYVRKDVVAVVTAGQAPPAVTASKQLEQVRARPKRPATKVGKDEALIPFGSVNLSSQPNRDLESKALDILRNGIKNRK